MPPAWPLHISLFLSLLHTLDPATLISVVTPSPRSSLTNMSSAKERQQTLAAIRQVDHALASDANAARQRTLTALRAASRFMAADTPHSRSSGSRASGRAIRFPKAPPASYSRAGRSPITDPPQPTSMEPTVRLFTWRSPTAPTPVSPPLTSHTSIAKPLPFFP